MSLFPYQSQQARQARNKEKLSGLGSDLEGWKIIVVRRRMMLFLIVVAFVMGMTSERQASGAAGCGEPVRAPKYQTGEKWTWRDETGRKWSHEVVRMKEGFSQIKWPGGDVAFHDENWIIRRVKRRDGELVTKPGIGQYATIGQKTLDFPLQVGGRWEYSFVGIPFDGTMSPVTYTQRYKIVACEEVATPAGRFPAFKIEVEQSSGAGSNGRGTYYLWYAPKVKNYVKRQYVFSRYWSRSLQDFALIRFEVK